MMTKTQELTRQAIIAALYAVLTWVIKDISYGALQFRLSEVLTLLVFYNKKHKSGLLLGCFLANIISPLGIVDMVMGTFASFLAFSAMQRCKNIYLASLMPGIFSFIIALELFFLGEIPQAIVPVVYLQILASEIVVVSFIGIPIFKIWEKRDFFKQYVE